MKRYKKLIAVLTAAIMLAAPLTVSASDGGTIWGSSTVEWNNSEDLGPYVNLIVPTMTDDTYDFWFDPEGLLNRFDPVLFPNTERVLFRTASDPTITFETTNMFNDPNLYQVTYDSDGALEFLERLEGSTYTNGAFAATTGTFWSDGVFAVWEPKVQIPTTKGGKGEGIFTNLSTTNAFEYLEFRFLDDEKPYGTVGIFEKFSDTQVAPVEVRVNTRPLTNADGKRIFDGKIYKMNEPEVINPADYFDYFKVVPQANPEKPKPEVEGTLLPAYLKSSSGTFHTVNEALALEPTWGATSGTFVYDQGDMPMYTNSSFEAKIISKSSIGYDVEIEVNVVDPTGLLTFMEAAGDDDAMVHFGIEATTGSWNAPASFTVGTYQEAPALESTNPTWPQVYFSAGTYSGVTYNISDGTYDVAAKASLTLNLTSGTYLDELYQITTPPNVPYDPTRGNDYFKFYQYSNPYEYEEVVFRIVGSLFNDVGTYRNTQYPDGRDDQWEEYLQAIESDQDMPFINLVFTLTRTDIKPEAEIVYEEGWLDYYSALTAFGATNIPNAGIVSPDSGGILNGALLSDVKISQNKGTPFDIADSFITVHANGYFTILWDDVLAIGGISYIADDYEYVITFKYDGIYYQGVYTDQ